MTGGRLTPEELDREVAEGRVDTVLLALPHMAGRLKGKRYDARHFVDEVARGGAEMCAYVLATDIDMTPLPGFALASWDTGYGDLRVTADLDTVRMLPWWPGAALVHADAHHEAGGPVEVSPRRMLTRQLDRLAARGLEVRAGLETEFSLYRGRCEDAVGESFRTLRPVTMENRDYSLDHDDDTERFLWALQTQLRAAGLPTEAAKTESGPGQVEITFPYGDALAACDGHTVFKHGVRHLAGRSGLAATFMAAPDTGLANGLHLHLSLWQDGRPVCAGPDGGPAPVTEHAVAGLLAGLPGLAPLYAPTANSYKRFTRDSFAPTRLTWGVDNRTCAVRVVGHGAGLHLEVRVPGADANPYLALTAALAAAEHGIEHELKPPAAHTGNAYRASEAPALPLSLDEAITAFGESPVARELLAPGVVEHYAHAARVERDALPDASGDTVTDAERSRWFSRA